MTSEFQSNQNYQQLFSAENLLPLDVLKSLLSSQGEAVDYETFKKEIEKQDNEESKDIANKLNYQIRTITTDEYKKNSAPITTRVTKVYSDGYVDVQKPLDREGNCWTHIPNHTIFRYLEPGDEVVLGYYNGEQVVSVNEAE